MVASDVNDLQIVVLFPFEMGSAARQSIVAHQQVKLLMEILCAKLIC